MFAPLTVVWIALSFLAATMVGVLAGVLAWLDDRRLARAVLVGGGASGGVLVFAVAAGAFLTDLG
ncbi:hypothetical protein [Actinoplanes auranticolor]|uniref:Uncharacterized protein n=1 Tax=Actinoplanes auranticolor TaxID=47988 RepID=A0A919VK66_9ACTN|nr:hypothetical protein [Actinoplanes auranticolor]GIM66233.1 hypothetical protein Aau02nite_22260 [Actinoplanes auranticolor]